MQDTTIKKLLITFIIVSVVLSVGSLTASLVFYKKLKNKDSAKPTTETTAPLPITNTTVLPVPEKISGMIGVPASIELKTTADSKTFEFKGHWVVQKEVPVIDFIGEDQANKDIASALFVKKIIINKETKFTIAKSKPEIISASDAKKGAKPQTQTMTFDNFKLDSNILAFFIALPENTDKTKQELTAKAVLIYQK